MLPQRIVRLSTGIPKLDELLAGGIPEGFFVALVGQPGTGKTIACLHFAWSGILCGEKCIYVTTEESRESIIRQAEQFEMDFSEAVNEGRILMIDALMREREDEWSLREVTVEEMIDKVIAAKKYLGRKAKRLIIDSMSAFWLKAPVKAREESYFVKRVLSKWHFTIYATSQYAITTKSAFGWGIEHVADGIIHFRRRVINGRLVRYLIIEKMRQTPHDLRAWEIEIKNGVGLVLARPLARRIEDEVLPKRIMKRMKEQYEIE